MFSSGVRTFDVNDGDDLLKLAAVQIIPRNLGGTPTVYFQQRSLDVVTGSAPEVGLRARNHVYMPENLTFWVADPVDGLPYPLSADDIILEPYVTLGYRLPLRGYLRTYSDGLNGALRVKWGDETVRNVGQTRGPYTGAVMGPLETEDPQGGLTCRYLLYSMHGKRALPAEDWRHRGGYYNWVLPAQGEVVAIQNGIQEGEHQIVISGGAPWQCDSYYWDGAAWQLLDTRALNLISGVVDPTEIAMIGWLFAGQTAITATPLGDLLPHFFQEIEIPGFEPWVLNRALWENRDLVDSLAPWVAHPGAGPSFGTPHIQTDLLHSPSGSPHAPLAFRELDEDLGYCVRMGSQSRLFATGDTETGLIKSADMFPLVPSDTAWGGITAPFTAIMRVKLEGMSYSASKRSFFNFGDVFNGAHAVADNGIGLFQEGFFLTARIYTDLGVFSPTMAIWDIERYQDQDLTLAVQWTGNNGADAGYEDNVLRIIVNGQCVASSAVVAGNPILAGTEHCEIGYTGSTEGWTGLFAGMKCFAAALTDDEIRHAFDREDGPYNLLFSEAQSDGEPGAAAGWISRAKVQESNFALFKGSPWATPEEKFDWLDSYPSFQIPGPTWDFSAGFLSEAVAVVASTPVNQITINGTAAAAQLPVGSAFRIVGSTELDGYWTVAAAVAIPGQTRITVVEDVWGTIADGTAEVPEITTFQAGLYAVQFAQHWDIYYANLAAATPIEFAGVLDAYLEHVRVRVRGDYVELTGETQGSTSGIYITMPDGTIYEAWGEDDIGWADVWEDLVGIAAQFNAGTSWYGDTEIFRWYDWFDSFDSVTPDTALFKSWIEVLYGVSIPREWPLLADSFDEGWNNEPFSTLDDWVPGGERNGRRYGGIVAFPVRIPANRNLLYAYSDVTGHIHGLALTAGEYATAAALAAEIQTKWAAAAAAAVIEWGGVDYPDGTGQVWYGWDGTTVMGANELIWLAGGPGVNLDRDVRSIIGLDELGPNGSGIVRMPVGFDTGVPAADWDLDEYYSFDQWSHLRVRTYTDPITAVEVPVSWEGILAEFGSANEYSERFESAEWGGAWHASWPGGTDAVFDTDLGPGEPVEDFEEGW